MSTYEEMMVLLTVALLMVSILNCVHKKQPSLAAEANGYFYNQTLRSG